MIGRIKRAVRKGRTLKRLYDTICDVLEELRDTRAKLRDADRIMRESDPLTAEERARVKDAIVSARDVSAVIQRATEKAKGRVGR